MSQVIGIKFGCASQPLLDEFARSWNEAGGDMTPIGGSYELEQCEEDRPLLLSLSEDQTELIIEGYTSEESWVFIERFSKNKGGQILHEGVPLVLDDDVSGENLSAFQKTIGALLGFCFVIGVILLSPFFLIYTVIKIGYHLVWSEK